MSRAHIGIIMGSDSDLPVMNDAAHFLDSISIPYEITIVSAHRTPEKMMSYAKEAKSREIEVIIAGAGGAAHLPGMVASFTPIPVIGVPIKTSSLDGLDSLLSVAQMPSGIPVATVAINSAKNAAILACQILGVKYGDIAAKVEKFRQEIHQEVLKKANSLETEGLSRYLESLQK